MKIRWHIMLLLLASANIVQAGTEPDLDSIRAELKNLRQDYEQRINGLEQRLREAEARVAAAEDTANEALDTTEDLASAPPTLPPSALSDFNPGIGVVLTGTLADFSSDIQYDIPGFQLGPDAGQGTRGIGLGESEINMQSNVDDKFFANFTLAVADEDGATAVELEEAYLQTLAMPANLSLTMGRFFSSVGYLNGFHAHADDFVDRPLPYTAFLGGQYLDDGIKASWLAPTERFFSLGVELLRGAHYPAAGAGHNGMGVWTVFSKVGGDVGNSASWKAGISYLNASVRGRSTENMGEFTGTSDLVGLEFVFKWAPEGNPVVTNLKLQGEYFARNEDGLFTGSAYQGDQSGWYLQGVYQFMPGWRTGIRYAALDASNHVIDGSILDDTGASPDRSSVMLEWDNSEFSRLRLQYSRDQATNKSDNQWYLQYVMSIGAHGAHQF